MAKGKTICTVCNYIYDEKLGEPRQDIEPAIIFDDLPEGWRCPECNSDKEKFQPCSCVSLPVYEQTCMAHGTVACSTNDAIDAKTSVGQLVAERPGRACILESHGIDYCCGGKISLEEACRRKGVSVEAIVKELAAVDQLVAEDDAQDWTKAPLKDLIEHIVTDYHEPLRTELPRVAALAEKVARVHGGRHPEMLKVLTTFLQFREQLELHMQKEEAVLFPFIEGVEAGQAAPSLGCGSSIEQPITVMTQEHDDAGAALCTMRELTKDYVAPPDACNTFKVLLSSLAEIESEMHQHVHKENNILFPRALALQGKHKVIAPSR